MYNQHQNECEGDMSFIEEVLLKDGRSQVKIHHMDSYNVVGKRRFQGAFYYDFDGDYVVCNEAPLSILKMATRYQARICSCTGTPHITWTIWFD